MLSVDHSISCGSCHQQNKAFTDGQAVGIGRGDLAGIVFIYAAKYSLVYLMLYIFLLPTFQDR